jgi:hypothetical protein
LFTLHDFARNDAAWPHLCLDNAIEKLSDLTPLASSHRRSGEQFMSSLEQAADQYRQRENECILLAKNAPDKKTRAEYYAQAEHYRRLAEKFITGRNRSV